MAPNSMWQLLGARDYVPNVNKPPPFDADSPKVKQLLQELEDRVEDLRRQSKEHNTENERGGWKDWVLFRKELAKYIHAHYGWNLPRCKTPGQWARYELLYMILTDIRLIDEAPVPPKSEAGDKLLERKKVLRDWLTIAEGWIRTLDAEARRYEDSGSFVCILRIVQSHSSQ